MALPALIEIVPPPEVSGVTVTIPGSKSITNRALVLAALSEGETVLRGALWSEDTQVMVECLQQLGFSVAVRPDPSEPSNRYIAVCGQSGAVPSGGTPEQPRELFVGNAGTTARFLAAMVCLGRGTYRLHGIPRMHERPQADLFRALRTLGYRIDAPQDTLPAVIHGAGPRPGECKVSIEKSSQFASALLLCARQGAWEVSITGENAEESPYIVMTSELLKAFPTAGGEFQIEPDASSASYFLAADCLLSGRVPFFGGGGGASARIEVQPALATGWQIDAAFPGEISSAKRRVSRKTDLGDSILTAMILAPFAREPVTFTDLGRLRLQECERVSAMKTELTRCGVQVIETGDTLRIEPAAGRIHGAEIETYGDHRIAMCFATMGLKVAGMTIRDPACVRKTFPNFFEKLAAPPPRGLGADIRDAATRQRLEWASLVAA